MQFRRVGVEPPAELDGLLVAFPVGLEIGLEVVIILGELPLKELVRENDGVPALPGEILVLATPDIGPELEELVKLCDLIVPLPIRALIVSITLAIGVGVVGLVGEGVPVELMEGIELPGLAGEVMPVSV